MGSDDGYVMGPPRRKRQPGQWGNPQLWRKGDGRYQCGVCADDEPVKYVDGVVTCTACGLTYDEPEDAGVLRLTREVAELRATVATLQARLDNSGGAAALGLGF